MSRCVVGGFVIPLKMGSHHPKTYKSMSLVAPFGDVGAPVQ